VSFAARTLCVASQRVFIVVSVYFVIDSVRKLLDTFSLSYGLDDRGSRVRFPAGLGIFLLTTASGTALRLTQPPIQWVPGVLFLGVKWPGSEADHSPPSSADVKNAWSYTSTPQHIFMVWCVVKHRDNFISLPRTFYSHKYREQSAATSITRDFNALA
jgi:hypothetical protein